jgi:hypothetical protein
MPLHRMFAAAFRGLCSLEFSHSRPPGFARKTTPLDRHRALPSLICVCRFCGRRVAVVGPLGERPMPLHRMFAAAFLGLRSLGFSRSRPPGFARRTTPLDRHRALPSLICVCRLCGRRVAVVGPLGERPTPLHRMFAAAFLGLRSLGFSRSRPPGFARRTTPLDRRWTLPSLICVCRLRGLSVC